MDILFRSILFIIFLFPVICRAQMFKGEVFDQHEVRLPGVVVYWANYPSGAVNTTSNGSFALPFPNDTTKAAYALVCSFQNNTDTFEIDDLKSEWTFKLSVQVTLKEVQVKDSRTGAYISSLQVVKTEVINRMELRKAACCDLAGCFETQSTVQPQTTNILTNSKELRILGLSGVYNQVLVDGLPIIQGLTYTYGINTLPGAMLDNIWVVKGANSVIQGYENMVGQITVFPREGGKAEPFTADALFNAFGEKHLNVAFALSEKKWTNYFAVHASLPGNRRDRDQDTFLDLPLLTRYSAYSKFRYRKENEKGISGFVSGRYVDEIRIGGQRYFDPEIHRGSTQAYGQLVTFRQPDLITKAGYRWDANHKLSYMASLSLHHQDSWFGVTRYQASQNNLYQNVQWEQFWGKKKQHDLKAGISLRSWNNTQRISFSSDTIPRSFAGKYLQNERIAGAFIENILMLQPVNLTLISGIRLDHHNQFGWKFTPRGMLRYQPFDQTDIRISAGTGWRTVNLFAENINLLTSGRDIVFVEALQPEESINFGMNLTQKWKVLNVDFTASFDAYHTRFKNQFFPDYDSLLATALIYNYSKKSVSNGIQLELSATYINKIDIRLAYNYLDVWRQPEEIKIALPYNSKHRVLGVLSVHSKKPLWQFDVNLHYYGTQRLPETKKYPENFKLAEMSDPFSILGVQGTMVFNPSFELFAGCENLLDFRQQRPIMSWENPYSPYFDTSFAYGPTRGRELYIGLRMRSKKREESSDE